LQWKFAAYVNPVVGLCQAKVTLVQRVIHDQRAGHIRWASSLESSNWRLKDQGSFVERLPMRKIGIAVGVIGLLIMPALFCSVVYADQGAALIQAAGKNDLTQVQNLLEQGTDVNAKDDNGVTALMMASVMGHVEVVKRLLDKGADVSAKDNDGVTALTGTSFEGHFDVAKLLVEKGADVNIKSKDGDTALMAGSAKGHTKIVELLKAHGAKE